MKHEGLTLLGGSMQGLRLPAASTLENPVPNQLSVEGTRLLRYDDGKWDKLVDFGPPVPNGVMRFTSLGKIGRNPPTNAELLAEYERLGYRWASAPEWLNIATGIQTLTLNETGKYRLTLVTPCPTDNSRQRGGRIIAEVNLDAGDKLRMIVGQLGQPTGGAGATSIARIPAGSTTASPLVICGGCGGMTTTFAGTSVTFRPQAPVASTGNAVGGAGQTGFAQGTSTGGAGYSGDGSGSSPARSLSASAQGGQGYGSNQSIQGGFGGGGGSGDGQYTLNPHLGNPPTRIWAPGGGGGYRGGAGEVQTIQPVTSIPQVAGGGGVGYCATANLISFALVTDAVGYIQIEMI